MSPRTSSTAARLAVAAAALALLGPAGAAQAAPGDLDGSFGAGGKVTTDFSGASDNGEATAVQADGKIVVVGHSDSNPGSSGGDDFAVARYNSDGSLDTTFDGDGKLTTDFFGRDDLARDVAIQSDGKIVVAGSASSTTSGLFALTRYDNRGNLDPTFGTGGKQTVDFGGTGESGNGVAIDADGKILVAGGATPSSSFDFALARLETDGDLDGSFGAGGKVTTDFDAGTADLGTAVAIDGDDNIVVGGRSGPSDSSDFDFAAARYTSTGALDTSFSGGRQTTDFDTGASGLSSFDAASDVAIQSDGKIVLAGTGVVGSDFDFGLVRYNTDGTPDSSFSGDGMQNAHVGSSDAGNSGEALAIQSDGKIVVVGDGGNEFGLARFNTDGALDGSFSGDGKQTTGFAGTSGDVAEGVAIQSDGKIVAAGFAGGDFAVARYSISADPPGGGGGGGGDTGGGGGNTGGGGTGSTAVPCPLGSSSGVTCQLRPGGGLIIAGTGGDDRLVGSNGPDLIFGGAGDDTLTGAGGEDGIVGGAGDDDISAGSGDDSVVGDAGNDDIEGGGGNDRIVGGAGNDVIDGGPGRDRINGSAGNDRINGGSGNDRIAGDKGKDILRGSAGKDRLSGGSGPDLLKGGSGNDTLIGGSGKDRLSGATGRDVLRGGSGNDRLAGGVANDRLFGDGGRDRLFGGAGKDLLKGGRGADVLRGGPQRDKLRGGPGKDRGRQ